MAIRVAAQANADWGRIAHGIGRRRESMGFAHVGIPITVVESVSLLTTDLQSADEVRLFKFPAGAYFLGLRRVTMTDIDTGATPAHVGVIELDDATTAVAIIASTTIGQGAGTDWEDADTAAPGTYVGSGPYYLSLRTSTSAATAAAGTITYVMQFSIGILDESGIKMNS